jgi:hypothetical protein
MLEEKTEQTDQANDLPPQAIEATKRRNRINALVLVGVFLLSAFAPSPWNLYAPVLFLIPLMYGVIRRIRRSFMEPGSSQSEEGRPGPSGRSNNYEPYSCTPKDTKDPRRYKPIG